MGIIMSKYFIGVRRSQRVYGKKKGGKTKKNTDNKARYRELATNIDREVFKVSNEQCVDTFVEVVSEHHGFNFKHINQGNTHLPCLKMSLS